jgi:hypothetical protein
VAEEEELTSNILHSDYDMQMLGMTGGGERFPEQGSFLSTLQLGCLADAEPLFIAARRPSKSNLAT